MSLGVGKFLDDVVVLDEEFSKKYDGVRSFSDDFSLSDFIVKDNEIHLSDELVLDDVVLKKGVKEFNDSYSLSDVLNDFSIRKNLSDEINLFDSDVKHFSKVLLMLLVLAMKLIKKLGNFLLRIVLLLAMI